MQTGSQTITPKNHNSMWILPEHHHNINEDGNAAVDRHTLSNILNLANIGIWRLDMTTGIISGCSRFKSVFGTDEDSLNYISLLRLIDTTFQRRLRGDMINALISGSVSTELPINDRMGQSPKWVKVSGKIQLTIDGKEKILIGIVKDITEEKNREQARIDMIAIINHELRSPLTSMRLYIQRAAALSAKMDGKNIMRELLEKADAQITSMQILTENYLDFSVIENGKIRLEVEDLDLVPFLNYVISGYRDRNPEYHFNLRTPAELIVRADKGKIAQVFINLLDNAIKYSLPGTTISVIGLKQSGHIMIAVKDEGKGIKTPDLIKLFDRFFRTEESRVGNAGGYGIGLYLVKRIIYAHKGQLAVTSCPMIGSEFYFTLPCGNIQLSE